MFQGIPCLRVERIVFRAGKQLHYRGQMHLVGDQQAALGINADASPIDAAGGAGIEHTALKTGGREHTVRAVACELLLAGKLVQPYQSVHVLGPQFRGLVQRAGMCGKRLSGGEGLTRHPALRYGTFLHRIQRLASLSVEQEHVPHLGGLCQPGASTSDPGNTEQGWL